jgi:hypothetical protein
LELLRNGNQVTVIARDLPGDFTIEYSSPWAGAHFRPVPITNEAEKLEQYLVKETYHKFEKLAADSSSGIKFIPGIEYFDKPSRHIQTSKMRQDSTPGLAFASWARVNFLRGLYLGESLTGAG